MLEPTVKIAWLGLLDSDDATGSTRAEDHLALLAQHVLSASGLTWSIELISCGRQPRRQAIGRGVDRVVLPLAGAPRTPWDRVSWELPDALAAADLVHLHDGFSRSCEVALLIAKQLRQPVCTTEWGIDGHWLSSELSLRDLADVVICHDRAVANAVGGDKPVELAACDVDIRWLGTPAPWPAVHCLDAPARRGHGRETGPNAGSDGGGTVGRPAPTRVGRPATTRQYAAAGARLSAIYHRLLAAARRAAA